MSVVLRAPHKKNLQIVSMHGYLESAEEILNMCRDLLNTGGTRSSKICVCLGDWNIDVSSKFSECVVPAPEKEYDLDLLTNFAEHLHCDIIPPREFAFPRDVAFPFNLVPVTKVPRGRLAAIHNPSVLDFLLAKDSFVESAVGDWSVVDSDHCLVMYALCWRPSTPSRKKRKFACIDRRALDAEVASFESLPDTGFGCVDLSANLVYKYQDHRSCRERSFARLPQGIRQQYADLQGLSGADFEAKLKCVWKARKEHWCECAEIRLRENLEKGRVVQKSKKLFVISGVTQNENLVCGQTGAQLVAAHFAEKWRSDRELWASNIRFVRQHRGHVQISSDDISQAFKKIKFQNYLLKKMELYSLKLFYL